MGQKRSPGLYPSMSTLVCVASPRSFSPVRDGFSFHFPENTIGPFRHGIPTFGCRVRIGPTNLRRSVLVPEMDMNGIPALGTSSRWVKYSAGDRRAMQRGLTLRQFTNSLFERVFQASFLSRVRLSGKIGTQSP